MNNGSREGEMRVWWIPQVPMREPFSWLVPDPATAKIMLDMLAQYDLFCYENRIRPDYTNAGGLVVWEDGEWCEWCDPETGDGIDEWELQV